MTKQEFLFGLRIKLYDLPDGELEERVNFYAEMIDDRIEAGFTEQEAIDEIGTPDEIAAQIRAEGAPVGFARESVRIIKKMKGWQIALLAIGSPIWLALLISGAAVVISLYAVLWSLVITAWSVAVSFAAGALGGIVVGGIFAFTSNVLAGFFVIGAAIACAGFAIFSFFGSKAATKGTLCLTRKLFTRLSRFFVKEEK